MYSDHTEFDSSPNPTATPIFNPQQIRENYFPLRKTPQIGTFGGVGVGFGKLS